MKITTTTGLVGFLLALATLHPSPSTAKVSPSNQNQASQTIEERLANITEALHQKEIQLEDSWESLPFSRSDLEKEVDLAGFSNFNNYRGNNWRNGGSWRNGNNWRNGGSWRNGNNWFNGNGWRNGWRDGGGFVNFRF